MLIADFFTEARPKALGIKMSRPFFTAIIGVVMFWIAGNTLGFVYADNYFGNFFERTGNTSSIFSAVLSTFHNLATKIGETIDAAIEEDCVYKCPSSSGTKPKPNPYHIPRSDGCGVPGLRMPEYIPISRFEKCCDKHDICYGTCNEKQQFCDAQFKECLYKICSSVEKYLSADFLKGCKLVAKTMYTAVTAMGCKYYLKAQEEACICYESSRDEF